MRRRAAVPAVTLAIGLLMVPAYAATVEARVGSYYFEDATPGDGRITVEAGDRITFTFEGASRHTATVDGLFDSGPRSAPQTYTTSPLTRAGTYTLYCQVHGARVHSAVLTVAAKSPGPSPTSAVSPTPKAPPTRVASPARTASPATSPTAVRPPSPAPKPSASRSPSARAVVAAPATSLATVIPASPAPETSPPAVGETPSPDEVTADVPRPTATADDGSGSRLPLLLALLLLLAALLATGLALRRRTP